MREPSGRILGATSNPGKIFALSANPAAKGSYESDVRDAGTVATWGVIRWRAAAKPGQIELLYALGQHRNAGRNVERLVEAVQQSLKANRSPVQTRVICSGAQSSPVTARHRQSSRR